jgi:repressor LexA
MNSLTARQQEIFDFIHQMQEQQGVTPSLREIAAHFGFRSMKAAADHVTALRRKGALEGPARRARALRPIHPLQTLRKAILHVPLLGSIPAGFSQDRVQEADGCISVDVESLGLRPTARTFALKVRGDSMIGRHIVDGDVVVLEHGQTPRPGDVVAALIDNENTLKTFSVQRGKPFLRAENPKYPDLIPAQELVIQGVMVALIRKVKTRESS